MSCFGRSRGAIQRPRLIEIPYANLTSTTTFSFPSTGDLTSFDGLSVEYLVVAGGGGGGTTTSSGGYFAVGGAGGAGGLLQGTIVIPRGNSAVVVGGGGAIATNGSDSTFAGLTAVGGGKGGNGSLNTSTATTTANPGGDGGSGGGGGGANGKGAVIQSQYSAPGQPTTGQGRNGGWGARESNPTTTYGYGGAGGGAGGAGAGGSGSASNIGGAGLSISITGAAVTYAQGGGNLVGSNNPQTANVGFGGGPAGVGGSGVVIVRYQGSPVCSGGTVTTPTIGGILYTVHRFTTNGTLVF